MRPSKSEVCPIRNGSKEFAADENETRRTFFGTGFVKSGPYLQEDPMGEMDFKFRTTSSNGILVIAIDDDDPSLFQAIELYNGHVVFSYNKGYGYRKLSSKRVYDNGMEVTIKKMASTFFGFDFSIKIETQEDEEMLAKSRSYYPGKIPRFVNADYVYWGGIENRTTIPVNV